MILTEIRESFLALANSYEKGEIQCFVREKAVGTFAHAVTMTLNKVVGVTDQCLWEVNQSEWNEDLMPVPIKKIITGNGKASKEDVASSIKQYLDKDYEIQTDDESDAVAVGLAWLIEQGILKSKIETDNESM